MFLSNSRGSGYWHVYRSIWLGIFHTGGIV
jgi:hypothetical protein